MIGDLICQMVVRMVGNLLPKAEISIDIGTKEWYPNPHVVLFVVGMKMIFVSDTKLSCPIGLPIELKYGIW